MKLNEFAFINKKYSCLDKVIGINDNIGVFTLTRAAIVSIGSSDNQRCDRRSIGPRSLHEWDYVNNICSCGSLDKPHEYTEDHFVTVDMVAGSIPILEALPYGFIIYVELINEELEDKMAKMPLHARTLQELFRYMIEWEWVYEYEPDNKIAELCYNMLSVINLPIESREWLINEMPANQLVRYLRGDTNAQERIPEIIPSIPEHLDEWLCTLVKNCRGWGEYDS